MLEAGAAVRRGAGARSRAAARCSRSTRRSATARRPPSAACIAAADSGPLRHRYGAMRDLVVGITVALSDGTLAERRAARVIKNVAGYDLGKLFTGSFGHARPDRLGRGAPAPAARGHRHGVGRERRPGTLLAGAAAALARLPLEADCPRRRLGRRRRAACSCASAAPRPSARPRRCASACAPAASRTCSASADDERAVGGPARRPARRPDGAVLKVSALPADLGGRARRGARRGRDASSGAPALGLSWLTLEGEDLAARAGAAARRARAARLHAARRARRRARARRAVAGRRARRAGRHAARQGALRPGADLPPGRLRGRDLAAMSSLDITRIDAGRRRRRAAPGTSTTRPSST